MGIKLRAIKCAEIEKPDNNPDGDDDITPQMIDRPEKEFNLVDVMELKASISEFRKENKTLKDDLKWADQVLKGQCDEDLMVRMKDF